MRDPEKDVEHGGGGHYTEIDPPNRLAFTWIWDEDTRQTLIELDFEEPDGVTTVSFTHSGLLGRGGGARPRGRLGEDPRLAPPGAGVHRVMRPVGRVVSPLTDRSSAPRQADEGAPSAVLEIEEEYAPAARDIQPGDELLG